MMFDSQSRAGRPEGTIKRTGEALENLYCVIEIARGSEEKRTGRKPSISKMCRLIVLQGGYHEIIACEDANLFYRTDEIRLGRLTDDGLRIQLGREGHLLLTNSIQCSNSLRRRYNDAKKDIIEAERYDLMRRRINDALGVPRHDTGWYVGWRPPIELSSLN
jgi:hypothetical protein